MRLRQKVRKIIAFKITLSYKLYSAALSEEDYHEDPNNSGLHVDDALNVPDANGLVNVNLGHPAGEADVFLAPQLSRTVKPHQVTQTWLHLL